MIIIPIKIKYIIGSKKREKYCKKINITFCDLTYDGVGLAKYLM